MHFLVNPRPDPALSVSRVRTDAVASETSRDPTVTQQTPERHHFSVRLSQELSLAKDWLQEQMRARAHARPVAGKTCATSTRMRPSPAARHRIPLSPAPSARTAARLFFSSSLSSLPLSGASLVPLLRRTLTLLLMLSAFLVLAPASRAATVLWTGGGSFPDLSDPNNWAGGALPNAGDIIVLSGAPSAQVTNSLPSNFLVGGITFDQSASFTLLSNKITLGGNITDNSRNHTQTITLGLTFNATRTINVTFDGTLNLGQIIDGTGSAGVIKTGAGILNLNGANGLHGPLTIQGGTVVSAGDGGLGVVPTSPTPGAIVLDGGALRILNNIAINQNRGIAIGDAGGGFGTLDIASAFYNGIIADNGGHGSFIKTGGDMTGNGLTLGGANTYSGDTYINQGILKLDFGQSTAPVTNILYHGSANPGNLILGGVPTKENNVAVGGGMLFVQPKANNSNSQSFGSLTLNEGNNQIKAGTATGGGILLNLGAITHNAGGIINFTLPGTTPSATNAIRTTTGNTNGILGGWAIATVGSQVAWAANDGSNNIVLYSSYTATGGTSSAPTISSDATTNVLVTNATTGNVTMAASGTTDINTLQITDTTGRTIDIGSGNTLRLGSSGAIWRSASSANATTIGVAGSAGTLTAGGAPNTAGEINLIGRTNETGGPTDSFIVNSVITDNGIGAVRLVIAGMLQDDGTNNTGMTELNAANSYSGGTYVNSGTLVANDPHALGSGNVTVMPGAQVILNTNGTVTNNFTIAGNTPSNAWNASTHAALRASLVLGTAASLITLAGDATIGTAVSMSTINSKITGGYNLTFEGPGTITLTNPNNDYSGNTNIFKAVLQLGGNGVIPHGAGNGDVIFTSTTGTLDLNGFSGTINGLVSTGATPNDTVTNSAASGVATLSVGENSGTATFGGNITDGANAQVALTKIGTGTQILSGANTYSGLTTVSNGALQAGATNAFSPNSTVFVDTSGILRLGGKDNTIASLTGTGIVENDSYNSGFNVLTTGGDNSTGTFSGTLRDGPGVGPLGITKAGSGTFTLTGNNTYTGPTTVNSGILQAGSGTALGSNSATTVNSPGDLQLQGNSLTVGSLSGNGIVENASATNVTLTTGTLNQDATFSGTIRNGGTGSLALTIMGTSTFTLSGSNTYTGPTNVNGGQLNVSGTIASDVNVGPGATFAYNNSSTAYSHTITLGGTGTGAGQRAVLGGSGLFNTLLTLNSKNNVLSPGNSPGVMTFMTSQLWNSFTYDWQTNSFTTHTAGTTFDQIQVQGGLNLNGGAGAYQLNVISLNSGNFAGPVNDFTETNQTWTILTTTTGITGFNAANWTVDGSQFTTTTTSPKGIFTIQQSADGKSLQVQYTANVPEPGSALLILALGLIGILKKKRLGNGR
jgi:autotransporter-associated beta strand protein